MANQVDAGRMFATLRAVGEIVFRATSLNELFEDVCGAVVRDGAVVSAGVLLVASNDRLRFAAGAGADLQTLRTPDIAVEERAPGRAGAIAAAFREGRSALFSDGGLDPNVGAIVPISRNEKPLGVFLLRLEAETSPGAPVLVMMDCVAALVGAVLERFDPDLDRKQDAQKNDRFARRFGLLNATNDAILRSRSANEMFQMVCDAATGPGKLLAASVTLYNPNSTWFTRVACSGPLKHLYEKSPTSADPNLPEGQGVAGTVFRTGEPRFMADVPNDPRCATVAGRFARRGRQKRRRHAARQERPHRRRLQLLFRRGCRAAGRRANQFDEENFRKSIVRHGNVRTPGADGQSRQNVRRPERDQRSDHARAARARNSLRWFARPR